MYSELLYWFHIVLVPFSLLDLNLVQEKINDRVMEAHRKGIVQQAFIYSLTETFNVEMRDSFTSFPTHQNHKEFP